MSCHTNGDCVPRVECYILATNSNFEQECANTLPRTNCTRRPSSHHALSCMVTQRPMFEQAAVFCCCSGTLDWQPLHAIATRLYGKSRNLLVNNNIFSVKCYILYVQDKLNYEETSHKWASSSMRVTMSRTTTCVFMSTSTENNYGGWHQTCLNVLMN